MSDCPSRRPYEESRDATRVCGVATLTDLCDDLSLNHAITPPCIRVGIPYPTSCLCVAVSPFNWNHIRNVMDKPFHLSVIVDLSPTQWALCAQSANPPGLSLQAFLSQLLAFLNAHIACKDENTLAVFGAFPGQRYVLFLPRLPASRSNARVLSTNRS